MQCWPTPPFLYMDDVYHQRDDCIIHWHRTLTMRWSKFVMEEQTDKPILEVGRLTSWYQMKLMQLFQCTQPVLEYCHTPRIAGDRWQNEMKSVWFCSILSKFTPVFNFDRASHEYEKFARSRDLQNLNVWVGRQAITWSRQSSEWSARRQGGYLGKEGEDMRRGGNIGWVGGLYRGRGVIRGLFGGMEGMGEVCH